MRIDSNNKGIANVTNDLSNPLYLACRVNSLQRLESYSDIDLIMRSICYVQHLLSVEVYVGVIEEVLKAKTQEELHSLARTWSDRMVKGRWIMQQGYSPKRIQQTKNGYEISMTVKSIALTIIP